MNERSDIEVLQARVIELQERLRRLEGQIGPNGDSSRSRRDLLKLAGAAVAGAAGGVLLRSTPAAATDGNSVVLGNTDPVVAKTNDAAFTTTLTPTMPATATGPTPLVGVTGAKAQNPPVPKPSTQTPGFLFFAPLQSYGGVVTQHDADNTAYNFAEGVDGYAGTINGTGVAGSSDAGIGVSGATITGIDLLAGGNGSFSQVPYSIGSGPSPGFPLATNDLELIREADGSLWASRAHYVPGRGAVPLGTGADSWRRMNSVRVDSAAGDGTAFVPARLVDTRDPNNNGGHPGPLQNGNSYDFGPFTGTNGIPVDAVGIVGNLTALAANPYPATFAAQGYLSIYPKGVARPTVSTVNFGGPVYAWPNSFTVGFGSGANAGSFTIYVFGTPVHVVVDVFAYLQ